MHIYNFLIFNVMCILVGFSSAESYNRGARSTLSCVM